MITVTYHKYSPAKQERQERIQLVATGFTLFLVMMDTSPNASMTMTILRVFAAVLGFAHVMFGLRLEKTKRLLGSRFEQIMAIFSGLVLITGGIVLRMEGSETVYLIQIGLGLFYIVGLPTIIRRISGKHVLTLDKEGFAFRNVLFKSSRLGWNAVTDVRIENRCLTMNLKQRKKTLRFYLEDDGLLQDIQNAVDSYTSNG
ncbi:hypothetical protein JXO52_03335 [bacterium]|nr:hypothetical protein [bacterium]